MTQSTNNQSMHQFVAGQQYDGSEVIAFLHSRDTTKPKKRAPSAYNCFIASTEQRELIKQSAPDITPKEMMSALAAKWKTLTEEEKATFKPTALATAAVAPTKPKRAPSAYNCFIASTEQRTLLKDDNPSMSPKDIMSALAAKWKLLTPEEQAAFKPLVNEVVPVQTKQKRPPTAYNRFIADQERRAAIKLANPDAAPKEIMSLMGAVWKTLSDADKAKYQ
jgi:hypothetical protein